MGILVTFAVPEEAGVFSRLRLSGVEVLVTGMGPEAARRALGKELSRGMDYDWLLTCGFCGALNPAIRRETVLVGSDLPSRPMELAVAAGARAASFHASDSVATTGEMKAGLWHETGVDAVEMESGVIRELAERQGIPAATLRVVSDEAGEDLPLDFNRLMNRRGGIHMGRLMMEIARRPATIPALLRLQRRAKAGAHALSAVLERVVRGLSDSDSQSP